MPLPIRSTDSRSTALSPAGQDEPIGTLETTFILAAPLDSREGARQTNFHIRPDFPPSLAILPPERRQVPPTAITPGPDGPAQPPMSAQPVLTRASLTAWQETDGLTEAEHIQRGEVAGAILAPTSAAPENNDDAGALKIIGSFSLVDYPDLTQLPAGLRVSDNLDCSGCIRLTQLPDGLSVDASLYCENCTGLTQLPDGLRVGGDLWCKDCTSLTQLADGMRVGGNLNFSGCISLTSLPNDMADWRLRTGGAPQVIELEGAGISDNLRQRLMQASLPGMQFYFDMATAQGPDTRFATLSGSVDFWHELAPERTVPNLAAWKDVLDRDLDLLRQFLGRLCDTADYHHPGARTRLAGRICDLLRAMDESPTLRRECSDRISDALQTCNDRVSWVMNQVEVAVHVHEAMHTDGGAALKNLILSFMRLDIVQEHARQKCETLRWVDPIEVFLAYESGLCQKLELPVSAENMLYASVAQVTPEDLEMAEKDAYTAMKDVAQVDDYFQKSGPWQRHLRHEAAKCWSWESMPPEPWPEGLDTKELQCAITQEHFSALKQPVLCPYFNTWHVYEAQDLIRYWIECGQDTLGQRLELAALKRPIKQA